MTRGAQEYRIEVLAGGDPMKEERLTRSLRDDLVLLDEVAVAFADETSNAPGSKGAAVTDLALSVVALATSKAVASILTTTITEWCGRERHRKVRIVRGDAELEITGNPSADQQRVAHEFIKKFEGHA